MSSGRISRRRKTTLKPILPLSEEAIPHMKQKIEYVYKFIYTIVSEISSK